MTEEEARDYFDHLPLDERLRLVRDILGDIETRISRARAELNGDTPQLVLPSLEGLPEPEDSGKGERMAPLAERRSPDGRVEQDEDDDNDNDGDEWAGPELAELTGGQQHTVNRLRLLDAAAHYEKLLKRYGYIKGVVDPRQIVRQERQSAEQLRKTRQKPETPWADWVARDADTLDRPYPHEWSDWVAIGDDEAED